MKRMTVSDKDESNNGRSRRFPAGIDRREFISNGCKLAGALLFASSLGALAGCGRETTGTVDSSSTARDTDSESTGNSNTPGTTTQSTPSDSAAAVNCRFYDNGTCSKTGRPCTNCIE